MTQTPWCFVAMEYYAVILNRTYLLTIDDSRFSGKVARGLTSIEGGTGIAGIITSRMAVHGDLADPGTYISSSRISKPNRADFSIKLSDISSVDYTPRKKWGMGYYPHDGRVFVTAAGQRREFIILGNQSGHDIASRLTADIARAKNR
jgi:hypothetical protein